jgi:4-hydroxybenzoate polyprenyltransferase
VAAHVRLVHPFPSALDGVVVAVTALLAGGGLAVAAGLGLSMIALQSSIGALNDLHDAPADTGRLPPKPIPADQVSTRMARAVVVGGATIGLVLAAGAGPVVLALAVAVLAVGFGYDLLAKGTPWSWLPFAIGIPILPVYGWVGATGVMPDFFVALVPMAMLAGAALAIANARADLERDITAGSRSVATALGTERAWRLHVGIWILVLTLGLASLVSTGAASPFVALVGVAGAVVVLAAVASRELAPAGRERAWEAEAGAVAIALVAWLAGVLG